MLYNYASNLKKCLSSNIFSTFINDFCIGLISYANKTASCERCVRGQRLTVADADVKTRRSQVDVFEATCAQTPPVIISISMHYYRTWFPGSYIPLQVGAGQDRPQAGANSQFGCAACTGAPRQLQVNLHCSRLLRNSATPHIPVHLGNVN